MSVKAKIAFLYTEIAGYTIACINALSQEADVLVYRWPVNSEAPFDFRFPENVEVIDRKTKIDQEIENHLTLFEPKIIVCSGWMDKSYLQIVKSNKTAIHKILCIDNHWIGNVKQRVAQVISPFYLKRNFTHAWVPGDPQYKFAEKLGFKKKILRGFYCADTKLFEDIYQKTIAQKEETFPKKILYVARYVEHKGIFEMWNAFLKWQKESPNEWEMVCVGTGDEWENRVQHEKIRHLGFLQPKDLENVIKETGIYILPSKFEPWGVSVQEFAVAGFPLLISEEVGAASFFCEGSNALVFPSGSESEIVKRFEKLEKLNEQELLNMARASHEIGMRNTPEKWANQLIRLIKNNGEVRN